MQSKRFTFNSADYKKILLNAVTFSAPALIVFLTAIQSGVPVKDALYAVYLFVLNVAVDMLKKYVKGSRSNPKL